MVEGDGQEAKAITCLSYDLGEGTGACHEGNVPPQGPPYNGTFYYLGGNADHFLTFVQQELGASNANLSDIMRTDITDLSDQKVSVYPLLSTSAHLSQSNVGTSFLPPCVIKTVF